MNTFVPKKDDQAAFTALEGSRPRSILRVRNCRWPIFNLSGEENLRFCNEPVASLSCSYCATHAAASKREAYAKRYCDAAIDEIADRFSGSRYKKRRQSLMDIRRATDTFMATTDRHSNAVGGIGTARKRK